MDTQLQIRWHRFVPFEDIVMAEFHCVAYLVLTTGNQRWKFEERENALRFILSNPVCIEWYASVPWPELPPEE